MTWTVFVSVRDCWQITFVTLNGFCLLKNPHPPVLNRQYQDWYNIPTKIKWKIYALFTLYFKFWWYTSYKNLKIKPLDLLFLGAFISFYIQHADNNFYKFLELHSTLYEKKIFVANFPFLTNSLKHPHPLNSQNPLSVTKVFCRCSLNLPPNLINT